MSKSTRRQFATHFGISLASIVFIGITLAGCSLERSGAQASASAAKPARGDRTALDEYIARPDTNYSYHLVTNYPGQGQTTFVLEMTSQAWLTTNEVDRPI